MILYHDSKIFGMTDAALGIRQNMSPPNAARIPPQGTYTVYMQYDETIHDVETFSKREGATAFISWIWNNSSRTGRVSTYEAGESTRKSWGLVR